jgi:energy-converting hydrogenase Eha subunit E
MRAAWTRAVLWLQGGYFLITGVWPLVSLDTFEAVTGPKTDDWLVITVGVLVAVIGAVLLFSAARRTLPLEVVVLALASSIGLALVDVVFVSRRVIAPIYLRDAALQALLWIGWAIALLGGDQRLGRAPYARTVQPREQ